MEASKINERRRRTSQEILQLLALFKKQQCSAAEFCTTNNISKTAFAKWRSRYGTQHRVSKTTPAFSTFHCAVQSDTPMLFAEVNGIRIYQPVAACFLKELAGV